MLEHQTGSEFQMIVRGIWQKRAVSTALVHCDGGIFTNWQLLLAALQALVRQKKRLLVIAVEGTALLRVDEVVPLEDGQHWFYRIAITPPISHPSSLDSCIPDPLLFLVSRFHFHSNFLTRVGVHSLLLSPLHDLVSDDEGDAPVENLVTGAAEGVEDGGVEGTGQGVLTVLSKTVVDNALLRKGA